MHSHPALHSTWLGEPISLLSTPSLLLLSLSKLQTPVPLAPGGTRSRLQVAQCVAESLALETQEKIFFNFFTYPCLFCVVSNIQTGG